MRNPREHALNHSTCLIHTGNDNDQFTFDCTQGGGRNNLAGMAVAGGVILSAPTGIQLDDPLKLMDPNGPETLG